MAGNLKPTGGIRKPGASRNADTNSKPKNKPEKKREVKPEKPVVKEKKVPVRNSQIKPEKKKTVKNSFVQKNSEYDNGQPKIKRNFGDGRFSRKKKVPIVILSIIGLFAITVFTSFLSYTYLVDRYENPITEDSIVIEESERVNFKIEKGENSSDIAEKLENKDLISSEFMFKLLSNFNGYDSKYSAGTHYLKKGLTYDEIMVILSSEPETVKVTFPEGFTVVQIAERLESNGVVSKSAFLTAVNSIDVSSYSFISKTNSSRDYKLEGYLFPDTYEFDIDANAEDVIYKMLNNFSAKYLPEYYTMAEELGLSVDEVVILASIVEKEAKLAKERSTIAGVYLNRLNSEDYKLLQCEATVIYVYKKNNNGQQPETITAEMLKVEDPYNTYVNEGLPVGPICNPSSSSIRSVLNYDNDHNYYFYVVSKDNPRAHVFSETFEQHQQAVKDNAVTE